jgi:uncharacterized protein (TIGR03086 family)
MSGRSEAARNHAEVAAGFTRRVTGTRPEQWGDPAPVDGWRARDVVGHLVTWLPGFLRGGSDLTLPDVPSFEDDPVAAWEQHTDNVQRLLDDPATQSLTYQSQMFGDLSVAEAIDRFYTTDVFMHTWDLARATAQDETLDDSRCRAIYEGMQDVDELMRASGQFGPRVEVAVDASYQDKLIGFIGRDPTRA